VSPGRATLNSRLVIAAWPEEKTRHSPPSSAPIAASSRRRVGLSGRPYPSRSGCGPVAGSRWYGAANTGPGRNGCPGTGSGNPARTHRVPSR
jgi:hypothetical protein